MDALEAILSRRSIRKYTSKPIPAELVNKLLEAGMSAPSAHNQQPWHFVVLTDHKIIDEIPKFHQYSKMLPEAPLAFLVCGDTAKADAYWVQDCSAAMENILIAARALELGAVWLGVYPQQERVKALRNLAGIPDEITPFAIISVGYPAEEKLPANRFSATRVHYNNWCQQG